MNWLDEIRQKPKRVKSMYAFVFSALITLVIAVLWFVSFLTIFNGNSSETSQGVVLSGTPAQSIGALGSNFGNVWSTMKSEWDDLLKKIK